MHALTSIYDFWTAVHYCCLYLTFFSQLAFIRILRVGHVLFPRKLWFRFKYTCWRSIINVIELIIYILHDSYLSWPVDYFLSEFFFINQNSIMMWNFLAFHWISSCEVMKNSYHGWSRHIKNTSVCRWFEKKDWICLQIVLRLVEKQIQQLNFAIRYLSTLDSLVSNIYYCSFTYENLSF